MNYDTITAIANDQNFRIVLTQEAIEAALVIDRLYREERCGDEEIVRQFFHEVRATQKAWAGTCRLELSEKLSDCRSRLSEYHQLPSHGHQANVLRRTVNVFETAFPNA